MDRPKTLLKAFWNCGDNATIEFAMIRARLNRKEKEVVSRMFDDCMTQEQIAEKMDLSVRQVQDIWYDAQNKLLGIQWVRIYANELHRLKITHTGYWMANRDFRL